MNTIRIASLASVLAVATTASALASEPAMNRGDALATIAVPLSSRTVVRDLGRAPANYPVSIVVTLPYRNDLQLENLIQAQGDPNSALYHRFLTPAQFAAMFGPTPQREASVMLLLERAGFRITERSANRTIVDATAPAAMAERYFRTQIHLVAQAGRGLRYVNARPAYVPRELAAQTFAVTGLSNLVLSSDEPRLARPSLQDARALGQPLEGEGGVGPLAWAQGYDFPVQHGYTGKNIRVGDLEQSPPLPSGYLKAYALTFDLQKFAGVKTVVVPVNGGCEEKGRSCTNGNGYAILPQDTEYLDALAPGVDNYLYQLPEETITDWEDGFNKIVSDNRVDVATSFINYGEGEANDEAFALTLDHIIRQGNALGITFVAESFIGATSSSGYALTTPADSPHVLAISSNQYLEVNAKGDYEGENVAGGGVLSQLASLWFPLPSYQRGISGVDPNGRNAPDLSYSIEAKIEASGGVNGPFDFPFDSPDGGWTVGLYIGPAPFLAWVAELDQMNNGRSGLINTSLYTVYKKQQYGPQKRPAFHDISGKGFNDQLSLGIGSIDGWNLANALKVKK